MTYPLKNYVYLGSKSNKQKSLEINVVVILKGTDENNNRIRSRDPYLDLLIRGRVADPDPNSESGSRRAKMIKVEKIS
jgi:hypothetical protein